MCRVASNAQMYATSRSENTKHLFGALKNPSQQSATPFKIQMHLGFQLSWIHFGN